LSDFDPAYEPADVGLFKKITEPRKEMSVYDRLPTAAALSLVCGLAGPAWANTIEILPFGDSITFGSESDTSGLANPSGADSGLGGYRFYLDRSLDALPSLTFPSFDFVGNRADGTGISGFADNQHFGVRGATAATDTPGGSSFRPSMLTAIDNAFDGPTNSINAAFDTSVTNPDAVLLQIGINRLLNRRLSDLAGSGSDVNARIEATVDRAFDGFVKLLDGDNGSGRGDGNTGPRTGLITALNDNSVFAADAHLFVAQILPRSDGFGGSAGSNDGIVTSRQPAMVADYNKRVKDELLSRMGPGGELEGRVTFVDLFSITLAELDLTVLADEFFSGDETALRLAINPEAEGGTDATDFVDWIYDENFAFDEGKYDEGTLPVTDDLVNPAGDSNNEILMRDQLHPTNLGYAITAQVWANALEEAYIIPEPSALSLLAVGGLVLAGRRRRRAI
jgi:hypothetical protein